MSAIQFPALVDNSEVVLSNNKKYIYKNGALRSVYTSVSVSPVDLSVLNDPLIKGYTEASNTPDPGSDFTVNHTTATVHRFMINADATIRLPTPVEGRSYLVEIVYLGAFNVTFVCDTPIYWPDGTPPTPTSVENILDRYVFQETNICVLGNDGGRNFKEQTSNTGAGAAA